MRKGWFAVGVLALALSPALPLAAEVPLGGFIPFVGIGMTDEFETFETDPTGLFSVADPSENWAGGSPLGGAGRFDIALLDTGATTHILTQTAVGASGFALVSEGFGGVNPQQIFGAVGPPITLTISDALGIYAAGLGDRTTNGGPLLMNTNVFRGQTSVSVLQGNSSWTLPNILGLPMAAQHGIAIRNSEPVVFPYGSRTMRTPQVDFFDLGTGNTQGIVRRTDLKLRPSASFLTGPAYFPNPLNIFEGYDDPITPTVVENGGLYLPIDVTHNGQSVQNVEFLFDTGADLTVMSQVAAADLGFDIVNDEPDFVVEVEGAGGVLGGIPGFYLEEMEIDAVGGTLVFSNVPVVVLNVPNPVDPANVIDAIIGMHVFSGRDLVIDAIPAASGLGTSPSLYISDPVTLVRTWSTTAASASWSAGASWASQSDPNSLWSAQAVNASGSNQTAVVSSNSQVFDLRVAGTPSAKLTVNIQSGATLTTFGETKIDVGGEVRLSGGKLDAQVVNIDGGTLSGAGQVFAGTGPVQGTVRNLSGRIAPDGTIAITGDLSNLVDGTIAIDLFNGGNDVLTVSRSAFLDGTLAVSLTGGFVPTLNQVFTILTYGSSIDLDFDQLLFPLGYQWQLSVNASAKSLELKMLGLSNIPGDFDDDQSVDGEDLALWAAGYGQPGGYSGLDFLDWQQNEAAHIVASAKPVPEPTAALLSVGSALVALLVRPVRRT